MSLTILPIVVTSCKARVHASDVSENVVVMLCYAVDINETKTGRTSWVEGISFDVVDVLFSMAGRRLTWKHVQKES
jgi:hypothetical protein